MVVRLLPHIRSHKELGAEGTCPHAQQLLRCAEPWSCPQSCFPAPVWHQMLHYILPLRANMAPRATSTSHWGYRGVPVRESPRRSSAVAGKGGQAALPCWVGDLGSLVQWGLCWQHWAAAVKVPAVMLRRVSSVHVIDDLEMWQIYWCPESLQPLRVFIVYLIISWVAKTDVVAANNRERNGANDERNNTSPHWSKADAMHCRTAFFFPKGSNTCFLYIAGFADA